MPDLSDDGLLVYPGLWKQARAEHPTCWQDALRKLCKLAKDFWAVSDDQALPCFWVGSDDQVPAAVLGPGERAMLSALARVDVELMILTFLAEFPGEPDPMRRLDPAAPGIAHPKEIRHAARPAP